MCEFVEGAGAVVDFHVSLFDFFAAYVEEEFAVVFHGFQKDVHVVFQFFSFCLHGGKAGVGLVF